MDLAPVWEQLVHSLHQVPRSGLLMAAVGAMLLGVLGSLLVRYTPALGKALRMASTFGLVGVLLVVVLQVSRMDPRFELAMPEIGLPEQVVEGAETRVKLAPDGHFWLRAEINGEPANFLVDTGATLTAISSETAAAAGLEPREAGLPVRMQTANGPVAADLTTIDELRFGNVAARGLDAIIAPGLGPTNVIGMNLLSRLASWRVEGDTMILVPHNPQPAIEAR
ncbi:TIGR02281 family clan AA aspartic protease [Croceibacterium sp. LX-88]|jgi:aspartyl protease family protein|uniref:TIGR02281 family clan AA aspartic protease n=1 Tax=Croceibacterium selenioxidans TaxID=2838833 RepID=A0ABS5W211_9SPHN|nr:TIGR02281 family clan AA aspartic protease [Croceibacterium selenioxidans]MBT2133275.1 TIGR02281 family clan AA aspartic protease [Croceibacterium selenioxidans]